MSGEVVAWGSGQVRAKEADGYTPAAGAYRVQVARLLTSRDYEGVVEDRLLTRAARSDTLRLRWGRSNMFGRGAKKLLPSSVQRKQAAAGGGSDPAVWPSRSQPDAD